MLAALQTEYGPFRAGDVVANGRRPSIVALRKDTFIFSAGRLWDRAKNISTLAQVAPHLPWPVYVAGENRNPEGETIDHPHVRQLGHLSRNQLLYWFGHASIYALPARYEPFGLSALEAGLAGCALVLGDIPSLREIWDGAAMFVPPNDAEALKQALVKLIVDRDLRTELGRTARRTAERYTPAKMAEGYLRAYAKLIEKSGTTRTFNIQHPASNIQLESDGTGFVEPSADCQPAIRQTDSLRYTGRAACAS
jgi:glycosyltransferase involved in cell wall biosynthesis